MRENGDENVALLDRVDAARLAGALLIAVSAGLHLRLYLGGYRDIHLGDIVGVDLAATFVVAVVGGAVLAAMLIASVIYRRAARLTAAAGVLYALGAILAYVLTRTIGFLGFEESRWVAEATAAKPVELVASVLLALTIWRSSRQRPRSSASQLREAHAPVS